MLSAPAFASAQQTEQDQKGEGDGGVSTNPQFLFDFGSPNAYLSHEAIPAIEKRANVKFEYVPILLGGIFKSTNNKSPAETLAGVRNKREFHQIETERFLKRFKVEPYVWNPFFPVNTLN